MRRILVTGSSIWKNEQKMAEKLLPYASPEAILVSGHADRGADPMAERLWARALGMSVEDAVDRELIEIHPADWGGPCRECCRRDHRARRWNGDIYCPAAGGYRNSEMVALGADLCLPFACWCRKKNCRKGPAHYTHGTYDCVTKARRAGIPLTWTVANE